MQVECETKKELMNLKYFSPTLKTVFIAKFFLNNYYVDELSKELITFQWAMSPYFE